MEWQRLLTLLRLWFERFWAYTGTLAAMALMLGTLGMGIYHLIRDDARDPHVEYFLGVSNRAGAEAPRGLSPLPVAASPKGHAHLRFEYGEDGLLHRLQHVDAAGRLTPMPGSRVAEQRLHYDKEGRLIRKENLDEKGQPVPDAAGVSTREYGYDGAGRLERVAFEDAQGHGVVPRMPGYATALTRYDMQGRPLRVSYLDGDDHPIVNAAGESVVEYTYEDGGRRSTRRNLVGGRLADNAQGFATEHRERTADGTALRLSWETAEGKPARHPEWSAASVLTEYAADGKVVRERYCGEDGVMLSGGRPLAEKFTRRSADGSTLWECYNAADGLPCLNPALGYAERVTSFGEGDVVEQENFWDEKGNPSPCYEKRYIHGEDGGHVLSLHADGSTEWKPLEAGR